MKPLPPLHTHIAIILGFSLLTIWSIWWTFTSTVPDLIQRFTLLDNSYPLVVEKPYAIGYVSLCLVFIAANIFLLGTFYYRLKKQVEKIPVMERKVIIALGVIAVVAITTIISSQLLWRDKATALGYQPCPAFTLLIDKSGRTAWVKDTALCEDKIVKKVLSYGSFKEMQDIRTLQINRAK